MRNFKVGFVIDNPNLLVSAKDTSIALMRAVEALGGQIYICQVQDILARDNTIYAKFKKISLASQRDNWFRVESNMLLPMQELQYIWMRKDPPVDKTYLYAAQLLDVAVQSGCKVYNSPKALINFNEKLILQHFSCSPSMLVTADMQEIVSFLELHEKIVLKSLDSYGGRGIFVLEHDSFNKENIINMLTEFGKTQIMLQKYLPEIRDGDKRILLINEKVFPKALVRTPKDGDHRGNIDAGANISIQELSVRDREIAEMLIPFLRKNGIVFAGVDIIGNYCTEINITSPTCVVQLSELTGINIAKQIIEDMLNA